MFNSNVNVGGYGRRRRYNPSGSPKIAATSVRNCPRCGERVSAQWSATKQKEYLTAVTEEQGVLYTTRSSFHVCDPAKVAQTQSNRPTAAFNAQPIYSLFDTASKSLRYPKIRLMLPGAQLSLAPMGASYLKPEDEVVLYRAGDRSKYKGQILVTDGRRYPVNKFYGNIDTAGVFHQTHEVTPALLQLLDELSKDPAGVAAKYGQLTGNCCFCGRALEQDKSTVVGYGPVCAKKYQLPWG